jgi:hypothetical protein
MFDMNKRFSTLKKYIKILIYYLKSTSFNIAFYLKIPQSRIFYEYHNFPFDISVPMPATAWKVMEECCTILIKNEVNYTLGWGTLLGIIRDSALIPHDTDIDVDVYDYDNPETIIKLMKSNGYALGRYVSKKKNEQEKGKIQQLTFYSKDYVIFDILFWYNNNTNILHNYSENNHRLDLNIVFFQSHDFHLYNCYSYRIPNNTVGYLEVVYGKDWQTPKSSKGDWKVDCNIITELS